MDSEQRDADWATWLTLIIELVVFLAILAMVGYFYFGNDALDFLRLLSTTVLTAGLLVLYKLMTDEQKTQSEIQERQQKIMEASYEPKIFSEIDAVRGDTFSIICSNKGTGLAEIGTFRIEFFVAEETPTYQPSTDGRIDVTATPFTEAAFETPSGQEDIRLPIPSIRQKSSVSMVDTGESERITLELLWEDVWNYKPLARSLKEDGYEAIGCRLEMEYKGMVDEESREHIVKETWTSLDQNGMSLEALLTSQEHLSKWPASGSEELRMVMSRNYFKEEGE